MNRISSSVACAFAALLVLSALPSPAGAIVNGTLDTTHDYVGALIVPNPGRSGYTGVQDFIWCSGTLIAPLWEKGGREMARAVAAELRRRDTWQGALR